MDNLRLAALIAIGLFCALEMGGDSSGDAQPASPNGGFLFIDTTADIPQAWRRQNWTGPLGQGSCVHAAMVHLFRWQGQPAIAAWWEKHHADGETFSGLAAKLEHAGIAWAGTEAGDDSFLIWAIHTRRGAGVVVNGGSHMVNLVGLGQTSAWILDSNSPERLERWDRAHFFSEWHRAGGWAVTPVYSPSAPRPRLPDPIFFKE